MYGSNFSNLVFAYKVKGLAATQPNNWSNNRGK